MRQSRVSTGHAHWRKPSAKRAGGSRDRSTHARDARALCKAAHARGLTNAWTRARTPPAGRRREAAVPKGGGQERRLRPQPPRDGAAGRVLHIRVIPAHGRDRRQGDRVFWCWGWGWGWGGPSSDGAAAALSNPNGKALTACRAAAALFAGRCASSPVSPIPLPSLSTSITHKPRRERASPKPSPALQTDSGVHCRTSLRPRRGAQEPRGRRPRQPRRRGQGGGGGWGMSGPETSGAAAAANFGRGGRPSLRPHSAQQQQQDDCGKPSWRPKV
jgi:hypothetical protein